MTEQPLHIYRRDDNILVFAVQNTAVDTVRLWSEEVTKVLDNITEPEKHLQDFSALSGLSIYALRQGLKIKSHPNAKLVNVAILIHEAKVYELARTVINVQPGGNFRLFTDRATAVAWLHEQLPD